MTQTDDPIPVLLVDDLQENLLALEALLRRDGLTFLKARTGDEALELLLVVGRGDDGDLADAGQHQHRDRVVDHRLVINRE